MAKKGLGKGLGALIPTNFNAVINDQPQAAAPAISNQGNQVIEINIDYIESNKYQPRKVFNQEALEELAKSIKEHGLVQPIVLRKLDNNKYQLVAGERRWRAARAAGLKKIPAIIKEYSEQQTTEIAIIENIQREDLNPLEEASAYQLLIDEFKLTQEELAKRVGKSRSYVANFLRLLQAPQAIQEHVIEGELSAGHARALLTLPEAGQIQLAEKIITDDLSVRETEAIVKSIGLLKQEQKTKKKSSATANKELTPELQDLEDQLIQYFGTKVRLVNNENKGKIEIEYYSDDDLSRIIELLEIS
jgi:ParB family chromosome partitioning protein